MGKHKHWSITFAITVIAVTVPLLVYYFFYVEGHRDALTARHLRAVNEVGSQLNDRFAQLDNVAKWNVGRKQTSSSAPEDAPVVADPGNAGTNEQNDKDKESAENPIDAEIVAALAKCESSGFAKAAHWDENIETEPVTASFSDIHATLSHGLDVRQRITCVYNNAPADSELELRADQARDEIIGDLNALTYAWARFAAANSNVVDSAVEAENDERISSYLKAYDDDGYPSLEDLKDLKKRVFEHWALLPNSSSESAGSYREDDLANLINTLNERRESIGLDYQTEPIDSPREPILGEISDVLLPVQLLFYATQANTAKSLKACNAIMRNESQAAFDKIQNAESDGEEANAIREFRSSLDAADHSCRPEEFGFAFDKARKWFEYLKQVYLEAEIGSPLEAEADKATDYLKNLSPLVDKDLIFEDGVPKLRAGDEQAAYSRVRSLRSPQDILQGTGAVLVSSEQADPREPGDQREDFTDDEAREAFDAIESSAQTLQKSMRKTPWFRNLEVGERIASDPCGPEVDRGPVYFIESKNINVAVCENAEKRETITYQVPLADLIDDELVPVDKVLIATSDGRVIYDSGRDTTAFSDVGYLFADAADALDSLQSTIDQIDDTVAKELKKSFEVVESAASFNASTSSAKAASHSWVQEVEIGLSSYLAYSQPYEVPLPSLDSKFGQEWSVGRENEVWYLIGLVETSRFDRETLRPNMVFLGAASAVLLLGLFIWPYLQVRFVSARKSVRPYQFVALIISVLGGAALITLVISVYFAFSFERAKVEQLAEWIGQSIVGALGEELRETILDAEVTLFRALGGEPKSTQNLLNDAGLGDKWPNSCIYGAGKARVGSAPKNSIVLNGPNREGQPSSGYQYYFDPVSLNPKVNSVKGGSKDAEFACRTSKGSKILSNYPGFELGWLMDPYGDHVGYHVSNRQALVARGNLSHRGYFKSAQTGSVSTLSEPLDKLSDDSVVRTLLTHNQIVIERIRTMDTGWLVTSAAFPIDQSKFRDAEASSIEGAQGLMALYRHKNQCIKNWEDTDTSENCWASETETPQPPIDQECFTATGYGNPVKVCKPKSTYEPAPIGPLPSLAADNAPFVLALTKKIQTLRSPILPIGFGFAVIRDQEGDENLHGRAYRAGDVIYHSDDNRALVENLFNETDQNRLLRTVVDGRRQQSIAVTYRGKEHLFYTTPVPNLPWSVVIFYDLSLLHTQAFEMGVVAYINAAIVGLFILVLMVLAYALRSRHRWAWIWPRSNQGAPYAKSSLILGVAGALTLASSMLVQSVWGWLIVLSLPLFVFVYLFIFCDYENSSLSVTDKRPPRSYTMMLFMVVVNLAIIPAVVLFYDSYELQKERHDRHDLRHAVASAWARDEALTSDMRRMLPSYFESTFGLSLNLTKTQFTRGCHHPGITFHWASSIRSESTESSDDFNCLSLAHDQPQIGRTWVGASSAQAALLYGQRVSSFVAALISGYSPASDAMQTSFADVSGDTDWLYNGEAETVAAGSEGKRTLEQGWLIRFVSGSQNKASYIASRISVDLENEALNLHELNASIYGAELKSSDRGSFAIFSTLLRALFELFIIALPALGLYLIVRSIAKIVFALGIIENQNDAKPKFDVCSIAPCTLLVGANEDGCEDIKEFVDTNKAVLKVDLSAQPIVPASLASTFKNERRIIVFEGLVECLADPKEREVALTYIEATLKSVGRTDVKIILLSPVNLLPWLSKAMQEEQTFGSQQSAVPEGNNAEEGMVVTHPEFLRWASVLSDFKTVWSDTAQPKDQFSLIRHWRLLMPYEKLAAIQLAEGQVLNLNNPQPLKTLVERGLAVCDPKPRLMSKAFAEFVKSAEHKQTIARWETEGPATAWSMLRIPFVALLALSAVFLAYTGQETIQVLGGLLAAGTAGTPVVMRLLGWMGQSQNAE